MRMVPGGFLPMKNRHGTPVRVKKRPAAKVAHFSAPLKGLSHYAELNETDPLLASVLTNWLVEEDRITVRPGYLKTMQIAAGTAVGALIPYYGSPQKLVAASAGNLYDLSGTSFWGGFVSDDWAWTSFANLSSTNYTIMVNGVSGVVSWDGTTTGGTGVVIEAVTAPTGATWVNPAKFDKIVSHMNRLWFADSVNLAVYYLPVQQKSGTLLLLPLNAMFKRGGTIIGIYTWSIDGGAGMDDALVIFTSNGEVAIYSGVDPASDFQLVGIFRFDAPMNKNCIINFGGDIYVMISSGFVPLTTMIRAETEQLGKSDLNVMREFETIAKNHRDEPGWQVLLNHRTNHAICNMPIGGGKYQQMIRRMPSQIWTKWLDIPARCWGWFNNHSYFGDDKGGVYITGSEYLNDNGAAITADVRFAWSNFRTSSTKNFKMMKLYTVTDGQPRPFMDIEVDYDYTLPTNQPEITAGPVGGSDWNVAPWDSASWSISSIPRQDWQGVTGLGRVGAPRVRVSVTGCTFSLTGLDILFEVGGVM